MLSYRRSRIRHIKHTDAASVSGKPISQNYRGLLEYNPHLSSRCLRVSFRSTHSETARSELLVILLPWPTPVFFAAW